MADTSGLKLESVEPTEALGSVFGENPSVGETEKFVDLLELEKQLSGTLNEAKTVLDEISRQKTEVGTLVKEIEKSETVSRNATQNIGQLTTQALQSAEQIATLADSVATATANLNNSKQLYKELSGQKESANTALTEITTAKTQATERLASVTESKSAAEQKFADIQTLADSAKKSQQTLSTLAKKAEDTETIIAQYELNLQQKAEQFLELSARVEKLLPGATSAGLASCYKERKDSYKWPIRTMLGIHLMCILALVLFGIYSPFVLEHRVPNWEELSEFLFSRVLYIAPIVWLAWTTKSRYLEYRYLEEEYAHREATSRSFEGYKRELKDVDADGKALAEFCSDVLITLEKHPLRIFSRKNEDSSILKQILDTLRDVKGLLPGNVKGN